LGRDDREVFPSEDAQRIRSDDQKTMQNGLIESAEESLPTTGGRRTFLTTRGPLRDQEGRVIGVFGIARDITERNFQEREIRAGQSRFQAIFDGVNDGIVLHDFSNGMILEGNVKVTEMFGYGRQEIRHLTIVDLSSDTTPFTRDVLSKWLERVNQGESPVFEWMAKHKDGHLFYVQISMRMAEVSGRSCVLVLISKLRDREEINQIPILL
jgi:PAS domain S-box-containing protein